MIHRDASMHQPWRPRICDVKQPQNTTKTTSSFILQYSVVEVIHSLHCFLLLLSLNHTANIYEQQKTSQVVSCIFVSCKRASILYICIFHQKLLLCTLHVYFQIQLRKMNGICLHLKRALRFWKPRRAHTQRARVVHSTDVMKT